MVFLTATLPIDRWATFFILLYWVILLGGMNTGFRLLGWPAGMGFVFLNLGLAASYRLFSSYQDQDAWYLLLVSLVGMAFFHLGEIFLFLVAACSLVAVKTLCQRFTLVGSLGWLSIAVLCLAILYPLGARQGYYPVLYLTTSASITVGLIWLATQSYRLGPPLNRLAALLLICLAVFLTIDWHHLQTLFRVDTGKAATYYDAYIPYWIRTEAGNVRLPQWHHQLRASLLWSSVFALPIALWLLWRRRDALSIWLVTLMVMPWILISSPTLFTLLLFAIPEHGAYRVQFLMPTACILGIAMSQALLVLRGKATAVEPGLFFGSLPVFFGRYRKWKLFAGQTLWFILCYLGYKIAANAYDNFSPVSDTAWIEIGFVTAWLVALWRRISTPRLTGFLVIMLCIAVMVPDLFTRLGIQQGRAWSIHSTLGFHWLMTDRSGTITSHTSARYQQDLMQLKQVLGNSEASFVSDLATSYYIAAETTLSPIVLQEHHSTLVGELRIALKDWCDDQLETEGFLREINAYEQSYIAEAKRRIHYLILNRDTQNYTAEYHGLACVGETEHLVEKLSGVASQIMEGQYLSLWQLNH